MNEARLRTNNRRAARKPLPRRAAPRLLSFFLLPLAFCLLPSSVCRAQEVVDKMVAVINSRELVTYTDVLWQLALEPGVPLERPRAEELNHALEVVINQRLLLQEAEKLPTIAPKPEEINAAIRDLISRFPSQADFYQRLARVGLGEDSEQLREIIRQRVAINNYVNFRFRSFTVVTPQEEAAFYRDVFVPRFRRQSPGRLVPALEAVRADISRELTEARIESDLDAFLDEARARAEITILSPP